VPIRGLRALLGATWFAADLSPEAGRRLAALGRLADIAEGTTVVREGAPCDSLGVVVSGRIALRLRLPGGQDRTILTVDPGDVFGWSAVLPSAIATSTGVAVMPTRAVMFDGDRLRPALLTDCDLAAAIYGRLLVSVARRLVATRMQLLDLYGPGYEPW
jgi:CRP/FNR family transcriptional regulator, cyclic AMP receptor protein